MKCVHQREGEKTEKRPGQPRRSNGTRPNMEPELGKRWPRRHKSHWYPRKKKRGGSASLRSLIPKRPADECDRERRGTLHVPEAYVLSLRKRVRKDNRDGGSAQHGAVHGEIASFCPYTALPFSEKGREDELR